MIASGLLIAIVQGEARPQLSPLLGYASFMLVALITCAGVWLLGRTARRSGTGGDDEGDGEERGGGSNGGGGGTPRDRGPRPEGDPDWWPDFERAFAAHVNERLADKERSV